MPVGTIVAWPVAVNPADSESWLECNGQSTTGYPELAAVVGAAVPNYQGIFLRGLGGNSAALGTRQGDAIRNISGDFLADVAATGYINTAKGVFTDAGSPGGGDGGNVSHPEVRRIMFDASKVVPTANENRPTNVAVRYLIRARP